MSSRKNILLFAPLLLFIIGGAINLTKSIKSDAHTAEESTTPIEVAKVKTIAVHDVMVDTNGVKKSTPAPKLQKTKVKKIDISIKQEKVITPALGSIGDQTTDTLNEIISIHKSNLVHEPIDLPDVKHLVFLKYQRVEAPTLFVPKGQWIFGGNIQYSDHTNENYKLVILDDWNGKGYSISGNIHLGYAIKDNLALGVKGGYGRMLLDIDNVNLNLGDDLNFNLSNAHYINQQWSGTFFMRNFISLFKSRQFGLFNDTEITLGGGRSKMLSGSGETLKGTYESFFKASVGISPGIMIFMQNIAAFEVSVGLIGFNTTKRIQTTNQVYVGSRRTSGAKLGVDMLSIKIGATIYLNSRNFKQR